MNSSELRFDEWKAWDRASIKSASEQTGVYAFRTADVSPFQRLKDWSDILYIGCTATRGGTIRKRLAEHLDAVKDHESIGGQIERIYREVVKPEGGRIEVGWARCKSHETARLKEGLLLGDFVRQHFELPPLNRQESAKEVVAALRGLGLSSAQMIRVVETLVSRSTSQGRSPRDEE